MKLQSAGEKNLQIPGVTGGEIFVLQPMFFLMKSK